MERDLHFSFESLVEKCYIVVLITLAIIFLLLKFICIREMNEFTLSNVTRFFVLFKRKIWLIFPLCDWTTHDLCFVRRLIMSVKAVNMTETLVVCLKLKAERTDPQRQLHRCKMMKVNFSCIVIQFCCFDFRTTQKIKFTNLN